jgi:hypothetical protein
MKRPIKKRLACREDRDYAAVIAGFFRSQELCNVIRGPDGRALLVPMSGADLAGHLEFFAKHGKFFTAANARSDRAWFLRERFAEFRAAGDTYEIAIEKCAKLWGCGESTVRDAVKPRTAKQ